MRLPSERRSGVWLDALWQPDPEALGRYLRYERGIEVPVYRFAGRGWLRVSIQGYNSTADVAALLDGLRAFPVR